MVAGAKAKGLTEMVDSSHSIRGRGQMREVAGRTREESHTFLPQQSSLS